MSLKKLRFAVFGNIYQNNKAECVKNVLNVLLKKRADISVERSYYEFLTGGLGMRLDNVGVFEGMDDDADYAVSLGGDGTLLRSAHCIGARCTPVIGVNMGRLGFLAAVGPDEFGDIIEDVYADNFTVDCLSMVQVETTDEYGARHTEYALNEIAVLKRDNASMISIRTCINGEYVVTYNADGVIVSTPAGSTAYSLSNGGPIMVPHTGTLCLTPVAPHSLNIRPIVMSNSSVITLEVESRSHNFLVAADGRSAKCNESQVLTIKRAPFDAHIVKPNGTTYFSTLQQKMMWGADSRAQQN